MFYRWPRGVRANGHLMLNSEKVNIGSRGLVYSKWAPPNG